MTAAALGFPLTGKVTSWGASSGFTYSLIATNLLANTANLSVNGEQANVTTFSSSGTKVDAFVGGIKSWSVDMEFQLGTPRMGNLGLVTVADMSGADALLKEWEIQIKAASGDVTALGAAWRSYSPGVVTWSAKAKGYLDAAILALCPNLSTQPSSATFTIVSGGTGKQLAGTVIGKSTKITNKIGSVAEVDYDFQGTGNLTTAGTATYLWAQDTGGGVYTITTPETSKTLTFQANSGQSFSGYANWTDISISNAIGSPVTVKVKAVGVGVLTGLTV